MHLHIEKRLPLLSHIWTQQQLADVLLRSADGLEFPCHRLILAASSSFFQAMLATTGTQMRALQPAQGPFSLPTLDLPSIQGDSLSVVLQAVYTGCLQLDRDNVEQVLQASSFLEVEFIKEACCQVMPTCKHH